MLIVSRSYQFDYFCGWRYLFSPVYRQHVRQKWGGNMVLKSMFIVGSLVSITFTTAAGVLLARLVLHLMTTGI